MGRYVAKQTIKLINKNNLNLKLLRIAILGFSFKDNIPDIRNTKVIQIINEFKNYNIKTDIIDPIVCPKQVKSEYSINIRSFNFFKKHKYDVIILAVSHEIFLKKINFYLKYYKNINKKIFVDIKNNYTTEELKKNNFIYFQL
jgi:UDP-N-acetyl-D-galactosamine dehydrogenase